MSGSQGNVKFSVINDCQVAIKKTKYDDRSLELEAKVATIISENCPELSDFFPKLVSFDKDQLVMSRVIGEELGELIVRVRRSNCRSLRTRSVSIVRSMCKIVLCVMETVTRKTGIVHNDLHTSNVMITKTSKESLTFRFGDDKSFTIKTYGYSPVIIDFGYAHIEGELIGSLQNSDIGYTLEYSDRIADARILLKTTFNRFDTEMKHRINNLFQCLNLNADGWFPKVFFNIYDKLCDIANENPTNTTDAKLTNVISRIDSLNDDIVYCCDDCYLYDIQTVYEYDDDDTDELPMCPCSIRLKEAFKIIVSLDSSQTRERCDQVLNAANAFKYYVIAMLNINKRIKQHYYSMLTVKDNLDIIDFVFDE